MLTWHQILVIFYKERCSNQGRIKNQILEVKASRTQKIMHSSYKDEYFTNTERNPK